MRAVVCVMMALSIIWFEANSRSIYTEFFSLSRIIFSFLGALMMFGLSLFIESLMKDPSPNAPVETWGINFYPVWAFFAFVVFFMVLSLVESIYGKSILLIFHISQL